MQPGSAVEDVGRDRSERPGPARRVVAVTTSQQHSSISGRISSQLLSFSQGLAATAPISSALLAGLADEIRSGGPVSGLLLGHPAAQAPLFGIRALAGVNQLVPRGRVPRLATHIQAAVRDARDAERWADDAWALAREAMLAHPEHIHAALDRPRYNNTCPTAARCSSAVWR